MRRLSDKEIAECTQFQSTHPRGVRLLAGFFEFLEFLVSIHAPARGATLSSLSNIRILAFQSTHPLGVRPRPQIRRLGSRSFNPRTCEGCDQGCRASNNEKMSFNPRTREGCDRAAAVMKLLRIVFQSTHPRGVRPNVIVRFV